jgi:hypothetical protein
VCGIVGSVEAAPKTAVHGFDAVHLPFVSSVFCLRSPLIGEHVAVDRDAARRPCSTPAARRVQGYSLSVSLMSTDGAHFLVALAVDNRKTAASAEDRRHAANTSSTLPNGSQRIRLMSYSFIYLGRTNKVAQSRHAAPGGAGIRSRA